MGQNRATVFSGATSGTGLLHHTGFWERLKSPHFYGSGLSYFTGEEREKHGGTVRDSPGDFRQVAYSNPVSLYEN